MILKIGLIDSSKFNPLNFDEIVRQSFTEIMHRATIYKMLVAFEHYIDGYPFDYTFADQNALDTFIVHVPESISKLQCVKRLIDTGRYTDLMNALDKDPSGVSRILFEAASTLARNSNMVSQFAAALGFTDVDTDAFFVEAEKINV